MVLQWDMGTIFGVLELMPLTALRLLRLVTEGLSGLFDLQASKEDQAKSA